ncbi:MAG: NfeD family protein [Cyanobacteria bacterium SID2]|nr:NfeD family protein [Cyanobacteria bacterium SID2]MBP0002397.1 NfeD family protein [Cyanobacteria bacterium SBC]
MSLLFESNPIKLFPCPLSATVSDTVSPSSDGRVFFRGSYWPARFYTLPPQALVQPGQSVNIVGRDGITLLVVPRSSRQIAPDFQPLKLSPPTVPVAAYPI